MAELLHLIDPVLMLFIVNIIHLLVAINAKIIIGTISAGPSMSNRVVVAQIAVGISANLGLLLFSEMLIVLDELGVEESSNIDHVILMSFINQQQSMGMEALIKGSQVLGQLSIGTLGAESTWQSLVLAFGADEMGNLAAQFDLAGGT